MTSAAPGGGKVSDAVSRVENELARIWAAPDDATGEPKVRASMMNLVVATTTADFERIASACDGLALTHPGRVFVLGIDPRIEPWTLDTASSAICRKEGSHVLCSDRVEIAFGVASAGRAASVVGALALPEVPTFLEAAPGAPLSLVEALAPTADRIVVDSAHMPWAVIAQLAAKTRAPMSDRNFVRAYSWRELVARFFDDTPAAARTISRVEIGRTGGGRQEPAAMLLGWLASRLGWTFESADRARDPRGGAVEIVRTEVSRPDLGPGEVVFVKIRARVGDQPLDCSCERNADPRSVTWTTPGATHHHALGFRDETWVLTKALDSTASDGVYRELAAAAAQYVALG